MYTIKTKQIYLRKIFPHDLDHEVSVTTEVVNEFFEGRTKMTFYRGSDHTNRYTVTINNATDPRFGGDFSFLWTSDSLNVGDLIIVRKLTSSEYELYTSKSGTDLHTFMSGVLTGKDRHALMISDEPETAGIIEINPVMKNYIEALKTKPFLLLAGISGTGKSQKVKELAYLTCPDKNDLRADANTPGNYCLVEVKPNWHDSTELLGYYSNLTEKYNITPFLHFVYKATQNPDVPFFVCLDEMNLAPVEQYFAEYLSVLETRAVQGNKIVSAELLSKKLFEGCDEAEDKYTESELEVLRYLKGNGLRLPENLFVIGTVNMDDTTHQFSRKVIDRAFTIEMNGDALSAMFDEENAKALEYADTPLPLSKLKPKYVRAADALKDAKIAPFKDKIVTEVPEKLGAINEILKNTPFRVSYRVQNELVLYLSTLILNETGVVDIDALIDKATLIILLEKILPRVQGDEKLLNTENGNVFKRLKEFISEDRTEETVTPECYNEIMAKLDEMDNRLTNTYFANFF